MSSLILYNNYLLFNVFSLYIWYNLEFSHSLLNCYTIDLLIVNNHLNFFKSHRDEMFIAYKKIISLSNPFRGETFIALAVRACPVFKTGSEMWNLLKLRCIPKGTRKMEMIQFIYKHYVSKETYTFDQLTLSNHLNFFKSHRDEMFIANRIYPPTN